MARMVARVLDLLDQLAGAASDILGTLARAIALEIGVAHEVDLVGDDLGAAVSGLGAAGKLDRLLRKIDRAFYVLRRPAGKFIDRALCAIAVLHECQTRRSAARWCTQIDGRAAIN